MLPHARLEHGGGPDPRRCGGRPLCRCKHGEPAALHFASRSCAFGCNSFSSPGAWGMDLTRQVCSARGCANADVSSCMQAENRFADSSATGNGIKELALRRATSGAISTLAAAACSEPPDLICLQIVLATDRPKHDLRMPTLQAGERPETSLLLVAGAATACSHTTPRAGPLVHPQLAKRAVYSPALQKHSQPPRPPPRATAPPASCIWNGAESVVSSGWQDGATVTTQSNAAQPQTCLPAKPSLAKRKHAAAQSAAISGTASASITSCGGADHTASQSTAAPQLLPQPSVAARPSLAHRKPAAAKPSAVKRRAGASKAPALGTIAEAGVAQTVPAVAVAPAAPTNLIVAVGPGQSLGPSSDAASTVRPDVSSQPPGITKAPARQRTKAADLDATAVHAKVVQKHADGKLAELTVPEAKCWLKGRKLPLKGKKGDLVARITKALLQQ